MIGHVIHALYKTVKVALELLHALVVKEAMVSLLMDHHVLNAQPLSILLDKEFANSVHHQHTRLPEPPFVLHV